MMRYFPKKLVDLAKVGISGPLFGVVLSIAIYVASFLTSPAIPQSIVTKGIAEGVLSPLTISPLSAYLISIYLGGGLNSVRLMTPVAEAAYLILLIHFANLLPIGQLDGGHVARSLTSAKIHFAVSLTTSILGVASSLIFPELTWLAIFIVLAWILSGTRPHIGAANMLDSMSTKGKLLYGTTYVLLLAATFPIRIT
jgi:Zn-dependent protease